MLRSQGKFIASLWLALLVQLWLDHHEGTWGQRRRTRLTRSTKHRSSSLFFPSLPVKLQSGLGSEWKFLFLKTRPMPLSLIMVQIKTGPIHLDHYQSHLTMHHNHIVRVLAKPFANLLIFFLQENKDSRAPKTSTLNWYILFSVTLSKLIYYVLWTVIRHLVSKLEHLLKTRHVVIIDKHSLDSPVEERRVVRLLAAQVEHHVPEGGQGWEHTNYDCFMLIINSKTCLCAWRPGKQTPFQLGS